MAPPAVPSFGGVKRFRHDSPYAGSITTAPAMSSFATGGRAAALPASRRATYGAIVSYASVPAISGTVHVKNPSGPPSIPGRRMTHS